MPSTGVGWSCDDCSCWRRSFLFTIILLLCPSTIRSFRPSPSSSPPSPHRRLGPVSSLLQQDDAAFPYPPGVGSVSGRGRKLLVVGTAHTPSRQQQAEVAAVIADARPDVVLVELDAERLELLLADAAQQRTNGRAAPTYGAELFEAVAAAKRQGIPVLLGDAKKPLAAVLNLSRQQDPWQFVDLRRIQRGARLLFDLPADNDGEDAASSSAAARTGGGSAAVVLKELDVARWVGRSVGRQVGR